MAIVVLAGISGIAAWGIHIFERPGPRDEAVLIFIPPGSGVATIARRLDEAGVIERPSIFAAGVRLFGAGRSLKAGEYEVPARATAHAIMDLLVSGRTYVRRLTIPEGRTTAEILDLVRAAEALSGEIGEQPGEGELLPETYHYSFGDSRSAVVARMMAGMQRTLAEL